MIIAACVLAYVVAGLFCSRYAYGWMRAKSIDGAANRSSIYRSAQQADEYWRDVDRIPAVIVAFLVLVLWPAAAVLGFGGRQFTRFLDGTKRLSQAEYRDQVATRDRRIAELEREAGIT